ncbi:NAD(P)H-binding protein [Agaribacter flavus]|uniref:NAD(P)H-binding protein n=1 Tax=Agaribacter flavus TaxID=1902781 RepID=A0ABV7FPM4_9ALTE
MNNKKSALVLGATGLVGCALVNELCWDERYEKVVCLIRSPLVASRYFDPTGKIEPLVINFENLQDYQGYFSVDHVYCCLGTTIKQAGSKSAFRKVDFQLIHVAAQLSRAQRVKSFVWISSVGANAKSRHFYLRVKGELENAILSMPQLNNPSAVRPPLLHDDRTSIGQINRPLERFASYVLVAISPLLIGRLKKYRPVRAIQVAREMVRLQVF